MALSTLEGLNVRLVLGVERSLVEGEGDVVCDFRHLLDFGVDLVSDFVDGLPLRL